MPADRIVPRDTDRIDEAVRAVLTGHDPDAVAAEAGLSREDLADCVDLYRAAGTAALQRRTDAAWYNVRIEFPDWDRAEATVAQHLGPRLDSLQAEASHHGWWFLRKHPHWRLRVRRGDPYAVSTLLDEFVRHGTLTRWSSSIYEPETIAFGGTTGMDIAHDLFCADSAGLLDHARRVPAAAGRREISLLLLAALQRAAGLDSFEMGDVLHRVAQIRPTPPPEHQPRIVQLAQTVRALLTARTSAQVAATTDTTWLAAFEVAGRAIAAAAAQGQLQRGPRAILVHIVIFHWNRLGLAATTQGVLAHAARTALLPQD